MFEALIHILQGKVDHFPTHHKTSCFPEPFEFISQKKRISFKVMLRTNVTLSGFPFVRSQSNSSAGVLHSLNRYSRYLALLDLDQRTLRCPSYSGSLVDRLASPHSSIRRGVTYLLHLESCLTTLTLQALLYTFSPAFPRRNEEDSSQGEDFLLSRGVCSSENDLSVMRFLSDLIKQHHAGRGPPFLRFSYCSMHLHKNTNAT